MKKLVLSVMIPVLMAGLFCYLGAAYGEHTGPGKYNDEDLKQYETPNGTAEETVPNDTGTTSNEDNNEDHTQDRAYWCSRGTPFLRQIDEANKELAAIDSEFNEHAEKVMNDARLQGRRDSAMKKLKDAERALNDLADEAHQKGVPVGWVRCDFNY